MKTDPIFYRLFQTFPGTFFELIGQPASEANAYRFASVELKQTAFRIDGVFLPLPEAGDRPIFFVEVQFQKDPKFYSRFFAEIFLYLHLYAPNQRWQAVVVFPQRRVEPTETLAYEDLLTSPRVQRIYLDESKSALASSSLLLGITGLIVEPEGTALV